MRNIYVLTTIALNAASLTDKSALRNKVVCLFGVFKALEKIQGIRPIPESLECLEAAFR